MNLAALYPTGELRFEIRNPDGSVRAHGRTPNRVLAAGRAHVAASLAGEVGNQRIAIVVGKDPSSPEDDSLRALLAPVAELEAEKAHTDGERLVVQAAWVADAPQTLGESGVVLTYEQSGSRRKHQLLYNRAVLDPVEAIEAGETVTLTWTLSFGRHDA
jgi:hypothetical protein